MPKPPSNPMITTHDPLPTSQPQPPNPNSHPNPTTILLFTWADASPRLIEKYTLGYRTLFPTSKIIVIRATTMNTFFGGQEAAKEVVREMVIKELYELSLAATAASSSVETGDSGNITARIKTKPDTPKEPLVLMHAFSNSGGVNLEAVTSVWHDLHKTTTTNPSSKIPPLPLQALIIDSAPGGTSLLREFPRWRTGISLGLKPFLPSFLAKILASIFAVLMFGIIPFVLRKESLPERARRVVNEGSRIPYSSARMYVYSREDRLIGWEDVERHASEARGVGYGRVVLERFEGSGHVAHMRGDPGRYWGCVEGFWGSLF